MLTWHEQLTLLMVLDEKLNRLKERRQYYIVKLNTQEKLSQTQEDIFKDLQEQIKELESIYHKINSLEIKD
ncbi:MULTISPECIES: hypothetical protein [Thermoanaerobacterium]|uniref:Uncharacterized protein n=2 Tax=Thermoanaerobacterium TaxID=28895 RepID=W9E809_9THEO|nr:MULTISPECIES: hypothetical protein [Thermoanaerobacterium]AFK87446.1 hypothetical protein Tsac_2448 [Thermoanaerobacterium saccharolyticum JW/SL-YS485]ETO37817.1 hypothetical protein V518_2071 [Thermoanaerobacterium aotearoense SCUT27]